MVVREGREMTMINRRHETSVDQAVRAFRTAIDRLPAEQVDRVRVTLDEAVRVQDAPLTASSDVVERAIAPTADEFRVRQRLLADSLTAPQVAQRLSVTRQTPHDRARAGTLLAVMDRGMLRFPSWQFDPTGPDGVLPELPKVIEALGALPSLSKIGWMTTPKALLPDSPAEMLRHGDSRERREVLLAAESAGRL